MAGITLVEQGDNIPLVLQIEDGNTGVFPQAVVTTDVGEVKPAINLVHVANGLYQNVWTMEDDPYVNVTYIVYSDAYGGTESTIYGRDADIFIQSVLALEVTSQDIKDITEGSSFNGYVYVCDDCGLPGTDYPLGTPTHPVSNITDAIIIAQANNLCRIKITGIHTLMSSISGYCLEGCTGTFGRATLNLNDQNIDNCCFSHLIVEGTCNGYAQYENSCVLTHLTNFEGDIRDSDAFTSDSSQAIEFRPSGIVTFSRVCGIMCDVYVKPGAPNCANLHNFCGRLHIMNMTGGVFTICSATSQIIIYDTCTGGTINICGNILVTDNSAPGCTVVDTTVRVPLTDIQANQEIRNGVVGAIISSIEFETDLLEGLNGYWNRGALKFTSGQNKGVIRKIQTYTAVDGIIKLRTAPVYPVAPTDTFAIIPLRCFRLNYGDVSDIEDLITASEDNIRGSDADTLKTLSDQIDTVETGTGQIITDVQFIKDIEGGRWYIDTGQKQMVFLRADNITEIARFHLRDADGLPAVEDIFERIRA